MKNLHIISKQQKHNGPRVMPQKALRPNGVSPLEATRNQLKELRAWPEGWNGYDVAAPDVNAITYALICQAL